MQQTSPHNTTPQKPRMPPAGSAALASATQSTFVMARHVNAAASACQHTRAAAASCNDDYGRGMHPSHAHLVHDTVPFLLQERQALWPRRSSDQSAPKPQPALTSTCAAPPHTCSTRGCTLRHTAGLHPSLEAPLPTGWQERPTRVVTTLCRHCAVPCKQRIRLAAADPGANRVSWCLL